MRWCWSADAFRCSWLCASLPSLPPAESGAEASGESEGTKSLLVKKTSLNVNLGFESDYVRDIRVGILTYDYSKNGANMRIFSQ